MGIKGLWGVLSPYSEKKSLHEIRGETIAIDLSGWICDSQNVTEYYIQPKLYLRNLFFRTVYLILADITPIFVLEGDAPELKRDVMAARNAIQFKGAAPKSDTAGSRKPDVARRRFKGVLKECESLLKCMGVKSIKGRGEAEATCAQLNAQGLVDAVVSQDSDCFAYGAKRVYRNFSVSSSAGGGAMAGSVDCYDADKLYQSNGFGRKKMVALAILCGCDYGVGACGSSINTVLSFLHTVPEHQVISRLLSWVSEPDHYDKQSCWVSTPGRCERCGHAGRTHGKNGCPVCVTHKGCNDTGHKAKVAEVKRELSLRTRALSCGMLFPEPKVMKEFLDIPPEKIDLDTLKTPTPNLIQFVKLMSYKLDWSERYCVEKFLPLLTKWHLQDHVPCRTIKPTLIKKKRTPRGVPSFEVVWSDIDGQYEELIPDEQFNEDEDRSLPWTSTERQDLMRQFYPELVEAYEESIKKPPKEKKVRGKKKKESEETDKPKRKYNKEIKKFIEPDIKNLSGSMTNLSLLSKADANTSKTNVSVSINKLKRKRKTKKGQKTIDSFIASKKRKSNHKILESLRLSFKNISINCDEPSHVDYENHLDDFKENVNSQRDVTEVENSKQHLLSMLNVDETNNDNDIDLSVIVDGIVSRNHESKTANIDNKIYKLVFDKYSTPKKTGFKNGALNNVHKYCSTPVESPIRRNSWRYLADISNNSVTEKLNKSHRNILNCSTKSVLKVNTSYFFDKLSEDRDAFELSMEYKHKSAIISVDCDTTVEYSLPDVCV